MSASHNDCFLSRSTSADAIASIRVGIDGGKCHLIVVSNHCKLDLWRSINGLGGSHFELSLHSDHGRHEIEIVSVREDELAKDVETAQQREISARVVHYDTFPARNGLSDGV